MSSQRLSFVGVKGLHILGNKIADIISASSGLFGFPWLDWLLRPSSIRLQRQAFSTSPLCLPFYFPRSALFYRSSFLFQALQLLAAMFEPFMPSFSAKIYNQMKLKRTESHEVLYQYLKDSPEKIASLIPAGHQIGEPLPIFVEISDE